MIQVLKHSVACDPQKVLFQMEAQVYNNGFQSSSSLRWDMTLSFSGLIKTEIVWGHPWHSPTSPVAFSWSRMLVFHIGRPGSLCLSNSTTIAAGYFPWRFNTCHLSVSKLQRRKFPKTDLLCALSISGAAVHTDGPNPTFPPWFCSIKIATLTLHSDKWEIYGLELGVIMGALIDSHSIVGMGSCRWFQGQLQAGRVGFGKGQAASRVVR